MNWLKFFLTVSTFLFSDVVRSDEIDDYIASKMEMENIPGLSLVIMQEGKAIKSKGYGFANLEHQVRVTSDTLFQSGSTAKQFTAAMILLLVEEDKLGLDRPLALYFDSLPSTWYTIIIRHLLTHTSGIKDYSRDEVDYRKDYTEEELIDVMMRLPIEFTPGSQWSYSNSGYVVLGVLISRITGEHWSDFARKRIFEPLNMDTADMISEAKIVPHRAARYNWTPTQWE